jgi:hypothetical protein
MVFVAGFGVTRANAADFVSFVRPSSSRFAQWLDKLFNRVASGVAGQVPPVAFFAVVRPLRDDGPAGLFFESANGFVGAGFGLVSSLAAGDAVIRVLSHSDILDFFVLVFETCSRYMFQSSLAWWASISVAKGASGTTGQSDPFFGDSDSIRWPTGYPLSVRRTNPSGVGAMMTFVLISSTPFGYRSRLS